MKTERADVLKDVLDMIQEMAEDWEYTGSITRDTGLLSDMGLASLDLVVMANTVQQHYGQVLPFPEFFADLGQRAARDISVGEWVDFIWQSLDALPIVIEEDTGES